MSSNGHGNQIPDGMVGEATETEITVGNTQCSGLLDTGSTISTVCSKFYQDNFADTTLQPLEALLKIECAGGQTLPYLGYIEVNVSVPCLCVDAKPSILLVVSDTEYTSRVPVLLGTNVLRPLMEACRQDKGKQFLQKVAMSTPWWLTFRSLSNEDRAVTRGNGRLGLVKFASPNTLRIPKNTVTTVTGFVSDAVLCARLAMVHPTKKSVLQGDIEVTPTLVDYNRGIGTVQVEISNLTDRPVMLSPRSLLCELQQAEVVDQVAEEDVKLEEAAGSTTEKVDAVGMTEEEFLQQFSIDKELSAEEVAKVEKLLLDNRDVFSTGDFDIGHTMKVKHRVDLTDEVPFKQRHRSIPPSMYEEVKAHLQQLLEHGIISQSSSPWASGIVLVRKKCGGLRFCIDYRQLNQRTVKDSYALPRIEELMDHLIGAKFFSSLDMRSGYYQVEMEEAHKPRTAFTVGPLGFYQCERMPFGLTNAPATFQRLMERTMEELHMKECITFIDDVLVPGKDFEQEMTRLGNVFGKLRKQNLKLNPKKCEFFKRRVKYCGHIVSEDGVETDPAKTSKIAEWPVPKNVDDVRQFLGFSGYYRRFVQGFSKVAKPLTDLLTGTQGRKKGKTTGPTTWTWGDAQVKAFDALKEKLTSPPILAYADFKQPFVLYTDASGDGLGSVLSQKSEDGRERVIAYASRGLSKSEKNYPAHKLEYLALKWSVTDKFHDYLYGSEFTVLTDNNPLTYVLTTARLDATGHRWLAALSAYNFNVKYRPGVLNVNADILSRLPKRIQRDAEETDTETEDAAEDTPDSEYRVITRESIAAICKLVTPTAMAETMCLSTQILDSKEFDVDEDMRPADIRGAQRRDPIIGAIVPFVTNKVKPTPRQLPTGRESLQLLREFEHLSLRRGVLHRSIQVDGMERLQLVLPKEYRKLALKGLHDDVGHMGRDKTLGLVRDRYYWPQMARDVEDWVRDCLRCKVSKGTEERAPLVNIKTMQPLELVCLDFLTLEMSQGGYENVLVITDHFTRYALAVPTKNQTAKTTADAFINNFVVHYGLPRRIHTDQGRNFESNLIKEMCTVLGLEKSHTTPYHAMGNGLTEKFNSTLIRMLKSLESEKKRNWKAHIAPLVHAYNASRQASTKYAPFMLMFGRQPRLPIDLVLGCPGDDVEQDYSQYVETLKKNLQAAYKVATLEADRAREQQKKNYDFRARGATIDVDDRVLVKVLAHEGRHKLADRWEQYPYVVVEQPDDNIPVFVVQREDGEGAVRTLHRNNLLPISTLPIIEERPAKDLVKTDVVKPPKKPQVKQKPADVESEQPDPEDEDDSSELYLYLEDTDEISQPRCEAASVSLRGEETSSHRGEETSSHGGEETSSHRGEETSSHGGEETSSHGGEETFHGTDEAHSRGTASTPSTLSSRESSGGNLQMDEDAGASLSESEEEETDGEVEDAASIVAEAGSTEEESDADASIDEGEADAELDEDGTEAKVPDVFSPAKSPPTLRRSGRKRKPPDRFSPGNYKMDLQQMSSTDCQIPKTGNSWERKAEFLAQLAMADSFTQIPDSFRQAILKIVSVDQ